MCPCRERQSRLNQSFLTRTPERLGVVLLEGKASLQVPLKHLFLFLRRGWLGYQRQLDNKVSHPKEGVNPPSVSVPGDEKVRARK
jgi:hypothetical protein